MNLILSNGYQVGFIKGAELNPKAVVSKSYVVVNESETYVFFTKKNFYMWVNDAWYNGGTHLDLDSQNGILLASYPDIKTYVDQRPIFRTKRDVIVSELGDSVLAAIDTGIKINNGEFVEDRGEATSNMIEVSAGLEEETKTPDVSYERVMKAKARDLHAQGKQIFLVKVSKAKGALLDTLTPVEGEDFDSNIETFFKEKTANKSTTQFMINS